MYMFTLASSNECSFSVVYTTASSTIYNNGVVATRPARLIVWLLLPSVLQLITELQQVNYGDSFTADTTLRWQRQTNQHTTTIHTQQSTKD